MVNVNRRSLSSIVLAPLALTVALGLSGCSSVKPSAFSINGEKVERSEFETELKAFASNAVKRAPADQKAAAEKQFYGDTKEKFSSEYVVEMMRQRLVADIIHDEVVAKKAKPEAMSAADKKQMIDDLGGQKEFDLLPVKFRDRLARVRGEYASLVKLQVTKLGSAKEYFEKNKAKYPEQFCASHLLVADEAAATAARDRILGGEDFAVVAKEVSTDTGSGANGGDLGCSDPAQYVPEFAEAVKTQPLNEVGKPVKTQFGYHVIKVTEKVEATFENLKGQIEAELGQAAEAAAGESLTNRLKAAKLTADPSLATVSKDESGIPQFVAPGTKTTTTAKPAAETETPAAETTEPATK